MADRNTYLIDARRHLDLALEALRHAKDIRAGDDGDRQVSIAYTDAEAADLRVAHALGLVRGD